MGETRSRSAATTQLPAHVQRHLSLAERDPQLRELLPDPAIESGLSDGRRTLVELLELVLEGYADRPALGARAYDVASDPVAGTTERVHLPRFDTITYGDLHRRATAVANAVGHGELRLGAGEFACIVGFSGIDYVTLEMGCIFRQAVLVPLVGSMGAPALAGVLADTQPTLVASSVADLEMTAELVTHQRSVRTLVVLDHDDRVDGDRAARVAAEDILTRGGSTATVVTMRELTELGGQLPREPSSSPPDDDERVALVLHSSGSTGTPKGAIYSARLARVPFAPAPVPLPLLRLHFTPLNHGAGRNQLYSVLAHGGTTYFVTRPDLSTLFEDIRLVRPTDGFFFPRALEMIYRHHQHEVARRMATRGETSDEAERAVLAEMRRDFLGDRMCALTVGGASTLPEVRQFVESGLGIAVTDSYGTTEVGGIALNGRVNRAWVVDYRLRDVPELGYSTTDLPYPRGELCVKTRSMITGYLNRPEATANLFDADGFVLTGDIVEEHAPDHIVYIDRRNDVIKLAQGEFVAAGALGTRFENASDLIHQIYLTAMPTSAFVVAVVVPDLHAVASAIGRPPTQEDLRRSIREELQRIAALERLKPFEVPRDFIIETEPFSQDNGLLTALRKRIRPAIERKYGGRIQELYAALERRQRDDLAALRDSTDLSVFDTITRALAAILGVEDGAALATSNFADLGGDSLGAIEFASLLEEIFRVPVEVNAILSPAGNAQRWARGVEASLAGTRSLPTFADVHGNGSRRIHSKDLDLAAFFDVDSVTDAQTQPVRDSVSSTVLLTGATGFLGRFLCIELLERLSVTEGGRLICVVRAPDVTAARARLERSMSLGDERLRERFLRLAERTLEIVVGDIADPSLGLDEQQFTALAERTDRIVHAAALVNHVMDYSDLFAPNVAATASLIEFAATGRLTTIDFVSSGAVSRFVDRTTRFDEDSPLLEAVELSAEYANGYGASKWAAEHLLAQATSRLGIPVNVFRGDMMLPHRELRGQINVDDVFSRLLLSVVLTGLAPASFYVPLPDGSRPRAKYDGFPVDFVAASIAGIGECTSDGHRIFNVSNHIDDGASLDVFVDWIEEAGYPVQRIADHDEWVTQFERKLLELPEHLRSQSSLPVLDSFREPIPAQQPIAGSERFEAALQQLHFDAAPPPLSKAYIVKCLDDLVHLGLVPAR